MGAQVPSVAPVLAAAQAAHFPVQAVLQQNPSAQEPLLHSLARVQAVPLVFLAAHMLEAVMQ
jgi:hypothetical protein